MGVTGDALCETSRLSQSWTYSHSISSPKVTQLTISAKVTEQGLCHCNSDAWGWNPSHQSGVISITDQLIFQNGKSSYVYRRNNNGPKTLPCGTPDTMLISVLRQPSTITCCDRFNRNCQYRQDRTSNTHRAKLIENAQMVDPIKVCTEVNLHDPSLLPTLQCTLQCMGHPCQSRTFPLNKLGGWKHTTAVHKSSKTNRHQALKHLRQY